MKKLLLLLLLFLLILMYTSAATVTVKCYNTGAISVLDAKERDAVEAKHYGKRESYFDVPGKWRRNPETEKFYFFSEEAIFKDLEPTKYTIRVGGRRYTANCPGFTFSCKMLNTTFHDCFTREGVFTARYTIYNFDLDKENTLRFSQPFLLRYDVRTDDGNIFTHSPIIMTEEFRDIKMTVKKLSYGSKYKLTWDTNRSVNTFYIQYDDCTHDYDRLYVRGVCGDVPLCTFDVHCSENEYCEDGLCEELDCSECQYAEDHVCVDYECCNNAQCQEIQDCINNSCVELLCSQDTYIFNHTCTQLSCREDEEYFNHTCRKLVCAVEEGMVNHTCTSLSCSGHQYISNNTCKDLVCDENHIAISHICIPCRENEYAFNNTCLPLECTGFTRAFNHRCVNKLAYFFMKLFS